MAGGDMGLRTVIEAVLDAKGFEEFKKRVAEAGKQAGQSGAGASEAGKHFDRLGKQLPVASFKILADEMLESAGIMGQNRVLSNLLEEAMMGLAAAGKLTGTAFAGATLGASLLIPLLLSLHKSTNDTAAATKDWNAAGEDTLRQLEELKEKTKQLTAQNQGLYDALLDLKRLKQEEELRGLQKQIEGLTDSLKKEREELRVSGTWTSANGVEHQRTAESARKHMEASHNLIGQLDALTKQERQLREELDGTTPSIREQVKAADELAKKSKEAAEAEKKAIEEKQTAVIEEINERNQLHRTAYAREEDLALDTMHRVDKAEDEKTRKVIEDNKKQVAAVRARYKAEVDANLRTAEMIEDLEATKRQAVQDTISNSIHLLGTITGKNKAAAIADAIFNTYAGAARAFHDYPWPYSAAVAAAVITSGLAQVAQIEKTKSGFDDPANDALVRDAFRQFGRGWAMDMTRESLTGFREGLGGLAAASGGSVYNTTNNVDRGMHVGALHVHGLYGSGRRAARDAYRALLVGERMERHTRLR